MVLYRGKLIRMISFAWCLIRVGVDAELKILETVKEVLNNFNAPLKLTITTCWDLGMYTSDKEKIYLWELFLFVLKMCCNIFNSRHYLIVPESLQFAQRK